MKIPFFNYKDLYSRYRHEFQEKLEMIGNNGAYIMQRELLQFEKEISSYTGSKYVVGVANATDGLQMAFMAGGLQKDDEVIFCSHTMVATASAIHFAGGIPVPVDAGCDHLIDPNKISEAITSKTKAICLTQLNGRTANMDIIQKIAEEYNLVIYEDAAQALGSKWKGKCAGTFGVASCISFYPSKLLGCLGDGGAVLTDDKEIYNNLLLMRDHGRDQEGDVVLWGFNSRLDNLQAAFLSSAFKNYQTVIDRRRQIARRYEDGLSKNTEIVLPQGPDSDSNHYDVYQNYEIEAARRDELRRYLSQAGIGTLIQWGGKAVHQFRKLGFTQSMPYTERLFERMLMLPLNMSVTDDDIDYICENINKYYK